MMMPLITTTCARPRSSCRVGLRTSLLTVATAFSLLGASELALGQTATDTPKTSPSTATEGPLETIVVTAQKREENIEKVPASIRAVSGETLENTNVTGLQEIADMVPGLYFTPGDRAGNNQLSIRGLTSLSGGQPSETAVVGYYVDDAPISDSTFVPDLSVFDLQRIEVLKGPQGTLFGEGSIGGTVRLIMNTPDVSKFSVKTQAGLEQVQDGSIDWRISAAVNIPLMTDKLAVRLVVDHNDIGGYVDDVRRNKSDTNDASVTSLRAALAWLVAPNFRIDASASTQKSDLGSGAFLEPGLSNDHSYTGFVPEYDHDKVNLFSLKGDFGFDWAHLIAVASYYDRSNDMEFEQRNFSVALAPLLGAPTPVTNPGQAAALPNGSAEIDYLPTKVSTQEVRLVSPNTGAFTWVIGAYHRKRHSIANARLDIPDVAFAFGTPQLADVEQDYTYEQYAGFGEATFEILRGLKLTGGARVFDEKFNATVAFHEPAGVLITSGEPETSLKHTLFKGAISYDLTPDVMAYALFSEGVRPPGLNAQPFPEQGVPLTYGPDSAKNYEAGIKSQWLDKRLVANLSLFRIDWSDVQVSVAKTGVATPIGPMTIPYIANAGEARTKGVEFDGTFAATNRFHVGASLTALDAKLTEVTNPTSSLLVSVGSKFPNIPSFSAYGYAEYNLPLSEKDDLRFKIEDAYVGNRLAFFENQTNIYTTPTAFFPGYPLSSDLPAYNLVNFRVAYGRQNWALTAFVENAFNTDAKLLLLSNYRGYVRGVPRSVGITLRADF
jgi:iron complex outermembrane recepter protein